MYSVVLMAALTTTTADVPSFGGRGCHGCWGARSGCYGCNGCYGYGGCNGCNGGCWGCYGGARYHGHGGCNGCYGGGYSGCYGGCNGGCFGYACHGCQGYAGPTGVVVPPGPAREPLMKPAPDKSTAPPPKTETSAGKGAKLIVDLPADAKFYIDDQPIKVNSNTRFSRLQTWSMARPTITNCERRWSKTARP